MQNTVKTSTAADYDAVAVAARLTQAIRGYAASLGATPDAIFADTVIRSDQDGRVEIIYDGAGYDYLSVCRDFPFAGDLRDMIAAALPSGLYLEDENNCSAKVFTL